jgi:2-C-methyl-D-erythritol 4-phosphate cytidylyltransferase/2-C-methyl-D-erythritol 2,4-cyclodiphosphate synthase
MPGNVALIVAAGLGKRFGGPQPKQYLEISGKPVLFHTIQAFVAHAAIDCVCVVIAEGFEEDYRSAISTLATEKLLPPVTGGTTRQASVRNGLEALQTSAPDIVLIHDGARPFVTSALIGECLIGLKTSRAVFAGVRVTDTLRRITSARESSGTVDRNDLWAAQTPQGFHFADILAAHQNAPPEDMTDDIAVAEAAGLTPRPITSTRDNFKITTREDLAMAQTHMAHAPMISHAGFGYDVHRFERGRAMYLCGVHLADSPMGLKGHSDADVALHALTDALLGAVGAGDIGEHFPPSEEKWKGAPSHIFIAGALAEIRKRGGRIINVDITIICETPKIGPVRGAMRTRVAQLLEIPVTAVNVKATTTEGLGFTGREEGIAAHAVVSVALPLDDI